MSITNPKCIVCGVPISPWGVNDNFRFSDEIAEE